jgi:hypothetical protein
MMHDALDLNARTSQTCAPANGIVLTNHWRRWATGNLLQNGGHSGMDQWNFVMHPVFAAKTCDPDGDYVRRWLPVLKDLPREFIHNPWEAPATLLAAAGVTLGRNYPKRILTDLDVARR